MKGESNSYHNLAARNPEIEPHQYKAGLIGVVIGLAPVLVYLAWIWLK